MTAARHLPSGAEQTAYDQGWNDDSLVIHLSGFIASKGLGDELSQYLADAAAEENADLDDSVEDVEEDDVPE